MSNKLKKFIWDKRAAFDDEIPSGKVWENIEASFSVQKKKKFILTPLYKWSMAAATDPAVIAGRLSCDIRPWWTAETGSFKSGIPQKENQ